MLTGRRTRTTVKLSLVPVGAGVALNALGDVRYSGPGLAFGLSGAMAAAATSRFDRPSWHLLQSQLRWALPALASQVVFLEPPWRGPRGLLARTWTPLDGVLIAVFVERLFRVKLSDANFENQLFLRANKAFG
ncbi:hypothetical protein IscW_ISCW004718 [Ixodes scapularis]|uniref:Uncharacterized protein n=1 Tax=Ixodes scapularis TaxID=6945 RepID=B7PIB1_IXOSC|nr:hypothetical protein IscW_ISCW004718 [Ixodes scapularis]|eukprot:XP_002404789.1 hypothetical protein IscW_ISCW004718 [Ixodes scapularis]